MSVSIALSPSPILQFFDNLGKPAVGGTLLTQSGGVNYATYSDPLGATPLPNPIPLNSRGEVSTAAGASSELFLQTGVAYTFTLKDSNGNQLWSVGNITAQNGQAVSFPTASGSANAQIVTNAVPISLGIGVIQWFLPVAANTDSTTINVDNTGAKNVFFLTKSLTSGELQIGVPAQIIYDGTQWNLMQSAKGPMDGYYADTGVVNALVITANMAQTTLLSGIHFYINVNNTNTNSSPTLNLNALGAKTIYYTDLVTPLAAGALQSGGIYNIVYDVGITGWVCLNPSRITGSFTGTLATGGTTTPSGTVNYAIGQDGKAVKSWFNSAITYTSNAAGMTMTGIPTIIAPASSKRIPLVLEDNTTMVQATVPTVTTGTSTTWTFGTNLAGTGGFTTSGTKGIIANSAFAYDLD